MVLKVFPSEFVLKRKQGRISGYGFEPLITDDRGFYIDSRYLDGRRLFPRIEGMSTVFFPY
jgi:hypothetical protein